jgi:hypothetical protein
MSLNNTKIILYNKNMSDTNQILTNPSKVIVLCLPGKIYSREFLLSFSNLLFEMIRHNIKPIISQNYSSCVHFSRALTFGGNVLKGVNQKPFQGELEYDYILTIDSDQVFDAKHLFELMESPYDVTAAMYMMEDTKHFPIVQYWNTEYFLKHGSFPFMSPEEVEKVPKVNGKYLSVEYVGMGFMLIKKEAVEKIKYPWFCHPLQNLGKGEDGSEIIDMTSEDVSFCKNLKEAGVDIMIDTSVRIGHLKSFVI